MQYRCMIAAFLLCLQLQTRAANDTVPLRFSPLGRAFVGTDSASGIFFRSTVEEMQLERERLKLGNQLITLFTSLNTGQELKGVRRHKGVFTKEGNTLSYVHLFIPLQTNITYTREKTGNREYTVGSNESTSVYWDLGQGYLVAGADTVASFRLHVLNLKRDSLPAGIREVFANRKSTASWRGFNTLFEAAWAITGTWEGKPFAACLDDETNTLRWWEEDNLVAQFGFPSKVLRRKEPIVGAVKPAEWSAYPIRDFEADQRFYNAMPKKFPRSAVQETWLVFPGAAGGNPSLQGWLQRVSFAWWLTYVVLREV
ncbi:MAG TPA: hypothetical protein PKE63_08115 [Lacibacter sp.]|nr:hypothetical protein [Lacibacter sp.]